MSPATMAFLTALAANRWLIVPYCGPAQSQSPAICRQLPAAVALPHPLGRHRLEVGPGVGLDRLELDPLPLETVLGAGLGEVLKDGGLELRCVGLLLARPLGPRSNAVCSVPRRRTSCGVGWRDSTVNGPATRTAPSSS